MTDNTRQLLEEQIEAQLTGWKAALDYVAGDYDPDEIDPFLLGELKDYYDDDADSIDVLNTEALSVEYLWRGSDRFAANVETVEIVLGTGGPHVEIVAHVGRGLEIVGYWSSETVRRPFHHPATEALAEELAEMAEVTG